MPADLEVAVEPTASTAVEAPTPGGESSTQTGAFSIEPGQDAGEAFIARADRPAAKTEDLGKSQPEATSEKPAELKAEETAEVPVPKEFAEHPRWKEMLEKSKGADELQKQFDEYRALVGQTKEDAEFMVQQARSAEGLRSQMEKDPVGFARVYQEAFPGAFNQVLTAAHTGLHQNIYAPAMAQVAAKLRESGQEDLAKEIEQISQQTAPQRATTSDRTAAQPDPEREKLQRERQEFDQQRFTAFHDRVAGDLETGMREKLDPHLKLVAFATPEQREKVFRDICFGLKEECDGDKVFLSRRDSLWKAAKEGFTDDHKGALVAAYLNRASANGALERVTAKVLKEYGLQRMKQQEQQIQQEKKAATRIEPAGGTPTGAASGKTMQQFIDEGVAKGKRGDDLLEWAGEQMVAQRKRS